MPFVFNSPRSKPDEAGGTIHRIELDYDTPAVILHIRYTDADGNVVGREQIIASGGSDAEYTIAQFLAIEPRAGDLNTRIEQALVNTGRIPPSTVS